MFNRDEGPAARSQSGYRGVWAARLRSAAGSDVHRNSGRFTARLSTTAALDAIAEVAISAANGSRSGAHHVSKGSWNRARDALGRTELVSADHHRQRFNLSWPNLLNLALRSPAQRTHLIQTWERAEDRGWGPEGAQLSIRALRAVAHVVEHSPSQLEYHETARLMEQSRRWGRRPRLPVPGLAFVVETWSGWDKALAAAGLVPVVRQRREAPSPAVETLSRCVDATGIVPTRRWFLQWCQRLDIPLGRDNVPWRDLVVRVRELRAEQGLPTPPRATSAKASPRLPTAVAPRRRATPVTLERVIWSLQRYDRLYLKPGQLPRQKDYMMAAKVDGHLVWPHFALRFGTFHELCRKAGIS
jgi:hypothetical protein